MHSTCTYTSLRTYVRTCVHTCVPALYIRRYMHMYVLYVRIYTVYILIICRIGKIACCLFFNTGVGLGISAISAQELTGTGLLWTNAADPQSAEEPFNVAIVYGMFILDAIIYFIIGWYVRMC